MTDFIAEPIFAGEVAAYFGLQTTSADPTTPELIANMSPMGFLDVPGINREAQMDNIFPLGTYQRQQRNITNFSPSARFRQQIQDINLMQMGLRNGSGLLNYYTILFGNSDVARVVAGAKVESMEIDIPLDGPASVSFVLQALVVAPSAVGPPAMTYTTDRVFYGYNLTLGYGANTYTDYISRLRIRLENPIVRRMPKIKNFGTSGSPKYLLISRHLKETTQRVTVEFELSHPLPINDVAAICRTVTGAEALLVDPCSATTRLIRLTMPDLDFGSDVLNEGSTSEILSFSATADAQTLVVSNT